MRQAAQFHELPQCMCPECDIVIIASRSDYCQDGKITFEEFTEALEKIEFPECEKALTGLTRELCKGTLEACNYREAYNHFNQFLLFPREERKRLCEEAFLNPTDPENLRSLNEVKARLDARPTEKAEQEAALKDLYTLWNAALEELERQLPDQAPKDPIALPSDWLAVVVGGKYLPTKGLRGLGDELVVELLEKTTADVMCLSRGDTGVPALPAQDSRFAHFKDMHKMMEQVAAVKGDRKVVFFQTIGMTWDNGQCMFNIETIESFLDELKQFNLLADGNAKVVHTSTFHASPASAKHQDSLDAFANYGLADYGASKVMRALSLPVPATPHFSPSQGYAGHVAGTGTICRCPRGIFPILAVTMSLWYLQTTPYTPPICVLRTSPLGPLHAAPICHKFPTCPLPPIPEVSSTDAYSELTTLIEDLRKHMDICHAHWAANPADAASRSLPEVMTEMIRGLVDSMQNAADLFFEDLNLTLLPLSPASIPTNPATIPMNPNRTPRTTSIAAEGRSITIPSEPRKQTKTQMKPKEPRTPREPRKQT